MTANHPDPIAEGLSQSGQRFVQLIYVAAAGKQIVNEWTARKQAARQAGETAKEEQADQERNALLGEARARWGPVHDPGWLKQADLLRVGEAWGAAVPYADSHPGAASAVRKCEDRLRHLHPHGMGHYDRARADGLAPLEAMRKAAPFFDRDSNVHEGPAVATPALAEGTGARWAAAEHGPSRQEWEQVRQERRAGQIIERLQGKMSDEGRDRLDGTELRTILSVTTNLPEQVIATAAQPYLTAAPGPGSAGEPRSPADVSGDNFPFPVEEAMQMSASQPSGPTGSRGPEQQTVNRNRRLNR